MTVAKTRYIVRSDTSVGWYTVTLLCTECPPPHPHTYASVSTFDDDLQVELSRIIEAAAAHDAACH